ncbi:MAG: hypothetical protein JRE58_08815 [Deltaproteobacteria bacterium]|nr:hypothetical protein [Deltaproteobacteria bacterium]
MSSILKALQKLETGSTQQAKGRLLTGATTITSDRRRRALLLFIILFVFITAGGFFLINRSTNGLNSISDIASDKPNIGAMGPAAQSGLIKRKIPETDGQQQTHSLQADLKPEKSGQVYPLSRTTQSTGIQTQAAQPPPPTDSDGKARQVMPADPGKHVMRDKEKNKAAPLTVEKPPIDQAYAVSPTPAIPMIDPSILKLQAIAWSPEAKDRMAVINNRILREKGSIEGYVIIIIDQDGVIVKKGTDKGRLVF